MNHELEVIESESSRQSDQTGQIRMRVEIELYKLLADQTAAYAGNSSSVPIELAQELLASVCFTLGIAEDSDDEQLLPFLECDWKERYEQGLAVLERKVERGKLLWQAVCMSVPNIRSVSLHETVKSIGTFWKRYNYRFFAHQIPCDIDYQLAQAVPDSYLGIDYVTEYLSRLLVEQDILRQFERICEIRLLQSYCPDYSGLLVNLCEPIVVNALGLCLIGEDPHPLEISSKQNMVLTAQLQQLSEQQLLEQLIQAAVHLSDTLALSPTAAAYTAHQAQRLQPRLHAALSAGSLSGVFLSFDESNQKWMQEQYCWNGKL